MRRGREEEYEEETASFRFLRLAGVLGMEEDCKDPETEVGKQCGINVAHERFAKCFALNSTTRLL
jgi:hypothetical protein